MRTPAFWQSKGLLSSVLLPLSVVYGATSLLRRVGTKPWKFSVPVICVGNLTAGGSGKTPIALYIGELLKQKNISAFFLSRGYGGSEQGPLLVSSATHSAAQVGDEPLLLAKILPTVVAKNRVAGARFAIRNGAKAIIMDDGFQNPTIAKTLSLLVIDGAVGLGNGRIVPAGPLRESLHSGVARADAVVMLNPADTLPALPHEKLLLFAKTVVKNGERFKGKRLLAFCGIAYPRKFFDALAALGATLVEKVVFADHHLFTENEIKDLVARAAKQQAMLATTAKDAARLTPESLARVEVLDMVVEFDAPAKLIELLDKALVA